MRLVRALVDGVARPGMLGPDGHAHDLSGIVADLAGGALLPRSLERLAGLRVADLPKLPTGTALLPPVGAVGKVIGVGLNYRDHAAECGLALPKEPTLFLKATSALAGPSDPVTMPRGGVKLDWEVEFGVVIGQAGAYIGAAEAPRHVAGYVLGIDFSERAFQFDRGGQGFKGKSADGFGPLGPFLATPDEIPDPNDVQLRLSVNGAERQLGSTRDMIFSVAELIEAISAFMSLQPGDVILTGTPAGVGMGQTPPVFLKPGDEVRAAATGLGEQSHRIVPAA